MNDSEGNPIKVGTFLKSTKLADIGARVDKIECRIATLTVYNMTLVFEGLGIPYFAVPSVRVCQNRMNVSSWVVK